MTLRLAVDGAGRRVRPRAVVVAGFTGRDPDAVAAHVAELAAQGVPAPASVPAFYRLAPELAVQAQAIDVEHGETSGEAEVALVTTAGEWLVTLASDHTDRRAEVEDIGTAKRRCPKVLATEAWRYDDVREHWDALELMSWIDVDGERVLYQRGTLAALLTPEALLRRLDAPAGELVLLTGTLPAIGGLRAAPAFSAELRDPVTGRSIALGYRIRTRIAAP